jgi:hypothetical protein
MQTAALKEITTRLSAKLAAFVADDDPHAYGKLAPRLGGVMDYLSSHPF